MHRRIDRDRLPDRRVVVELDFQGSDAIHVWLVLDRGEPSVCVTHPGFDSDVIVVSEPVDLMRVFSGIVTLAQAVDAGSVDVLGPPSLTRQLNAWFTWSPFHAAVQARVADG
jgi:hypothetical protein